MSGFSIHDEDGRITSSHKVYEPEGYDRKLHEHGLRFARHETRTHANLDHNFIWNGELSDRPLSPVRCGFIHLKVGQGTYIHGIPLGAHVTVSAQGVGMPMHDGPLNGRTIDFDSPVPGVFTVTVRKWPMREWSQTIVVEQS